MDLPHSTVSFHSRRHSFADSWLAGLSLSFGVSRDLPAQPTGTAPLGLTHSKGQNPTEKYRTSRKQVTFCLHTLMHVIRPLICHLPCEMALPTCVTCVYQSPALAWSSRRWAQRLTTQRSGSHSLYQSRSPSRRLARSLSFRRAAELQKSDTYLSTFDRQRRIRINPIFSSLS